MLRWQAIVTRSTPRRHHKPSTSRRWLHGDSENPTRPNRHAQFYSDLVPAMIPVALLGSAVYMVRNAPCPHDRLCFVQARLIFYAIWNLLGPAAAADTFVT